MLVCISVGVAVLMAVVLFRLFFSDLPDFVESLSRLSSATWKVLFWGSLAAVMGIAAYYTLPRHFPKLARSGGPKAATATVATDAKSKSTVVQARSSSTNSVAAPAPREATIRGVKLGDNVQISAIHPPVALRSAVITSMDDTQLTVRATSGSYTVLWKDLTGLKASTNRPGQF
jgi:hypothetical protein